MSRQISYLFTVWFSIIFLYSLWHGRISDMVTGGPFTCSLPAVPAFSPMKLLTRRKLMKFSECVHEWLISLLGLIFFVLICVTYFGGLSFSRYANATGVDRGVTAVDGEQILFLHPPSSKERHWNSSDAAVSLVWWTTDPVHWVSWPGDGLLPLHPPLWYDGKLIHSSTLIQLIFIQVLWQDKKGGMPMYSSHGLWLVPRDLWASRSGVRAWTTTQQVRAPLTCCSVLLRGVYLHLYLSPHQSPILIKTTISSYRDRLAREESVMKILRERTSWFTSF